MDAFNHNIETARLSGLNARQLLVPYTIGLLILLASLHTVIAIEGGGPSSVVAVSGLVLVAVYYAAFYLLKSSILNKIRFGQLVVHAITYVFVIGSYQLHAALITLSGSSALLGNADFAVASNWFGPTFAMAGFWAIGFAVHAVASVAQRGFED